MNSFTNFKRSTHPAILMLGSPGTGKTTTAAMIGKHPHIINLDNNIEGPFTYLSKHNLPCNATFDTPHIKPDGTLVDRALRWGAMNKCINDAHKSDPTIDWWVIDGLSSLVMYALDEVRRQQNVPIGDAMKGTKDGLIERQHWGAFGGLMRQWFLAMRAMGNLIVTGHVNLEKDELAGFDRVFVNVPGAFRTEIAGLFTDVWFFQVEQGKTPETKDKYTRTIRTVPNGDREGAMGLKSGLQLSNKFEVDLPNLNKQLGFV